MSMILTSAQISLAENSKDQLEFNDYGGRVVINEYLDELLSPYIEEKVFYEENEEVNYKVIPFNNINLLKKDIQKQSIQLIKELQGMRGKKERELLAIRIADLNTIFVILIDVLCNMINKEKKSELVIF